MRSRRLAQHAIVLPLVLSLAACHLASPLQPPAAATTRLDPSKLLDDLAHKSNVSWEDGVLSSAPLLEARRSHAYHTTAIGTGTLSWSKAMGAATSSAPAFLLSNVYASGPNPGANDRLFAVTDTGTLNEYDPSTGNLLASKSGLGSFSKTALMISADSARIYLPTTTGNLVIVDAKTLNVLYNQKISRSGFTASAPFVDYDAATVGTGGVYGANENLYLLSNDGSLYRVNVHGSTVLSVDAWPASNGTDVANPEPSWGTNHAIPYGVAVSAGDYPIVWNSKAYFGSKSGTFYKVNLTNPNSPAVTSWNLAAYTSSTGSGAAITAPSAIDLNTSTFDVNAIFVPCGDRVDWIDPVGGSVTSSPSLTLDHIPTAIAGPLSGYAPKSTSVKSYTASDWVSIKAKTLPSPTRWGGNVAGINPTTVEAVSIKYDPTHDVIWTANYNNNTVVRLKPDGTILGTYACDSQPNELAVDSSGNCWVCCGPWPGNASNRLDEFSPTGTLMKSLALSRALWPAPDSAGNCFVTTYGNVDKIAASPSWAELFGAPPAINSSFSIAVDSSGDPWVTSYAGNRVYVLNGSTGATIKTINLGARTPSYIAFDSSGNAWVTDYGSNKISKISPTYAVTNYNLPGAPWAVAIDANGDPWVSLLSPKEVCKLDGATGTVLATYSMSAYGQDYEMTFDSSGVGWVCTDSGVVTILDIGNLEDIFGAPYLGVSTDGDNSYGYLKFKIPKNAFGGDAPTAANLTLTAHSTPSSTDNVAIYNASAYAPGGTTLWTGFNSTPNVDYSNRPTVSGPIVTQTGLSAVLNSSYAFNVPLPSDQLNTTDAANAEYAYAERTTNKKLADAVHWYSNKSAGTTTAYKPTLNVTLATGASLPTTNGILCQPTLDSVKHLVYVASSNGLFQLDYSSAANFASTADTYYDLTSAGRSFGTTTTGGAKKYLFQPTNVLFDLSGHVVLADENLTSNVLTLNDFNGNASASNDRLSYTLNVSPGTGTIGSAMIYDYNGGSVYLTTSNNEIERAQILK
ncbi:MAG TPA: hypothetical protein V6D47_20100 [Oscillatoriaceae cyanobacterium]